MTRRALPFASLYLVAAAAYAEAQSGRPGADSGLEEVIVTAQKRAEKLQDVPISISVVGGADLDRSTIPSAQGVLSRIPGVALDTGGSAGSAGAGTSQLGIRGVIATGSYYSGGSTVGYYLDSVPFGFVKSAGIPDVNIYDLERIEVLRGPQGTLYGAGGLAGVARVLTHDADLDDFEVKMRATGSSTKDGGENYRGDMAVNAPLVDGKLGARLVAGYEDWSGWIDRPTRSDANDTESHNVRLKLKAQPIDKLSIGLSGWTSSSETGAPPAGNPTSLFRQFPDVEPRSTDFETYGLEAAYAFSPFSLTSSTSYVDFISRSDVAADATGTRSLFQLRLAAKTFSQEINLSSTHEGPWRWTGGAIYRDSQDSQFISVTGLPIPLLNKFTSESAALFGEVTRELIDGHVEITAGLRYFEDDVGIEEISDAGFALVLPLIQRETSFHATTPRLIVTWKPQDHATFYASYSEGFRSGFDQQPLIIRSRPNFLPVKPDTLKNYEIGSKGSLLGDRLGFDAAVYYMDWQDVQQSLLMIFPELGNTAARTVGLNGTSASGAGVDLSLVAQLSEGLEVSVNGSWNDLTMDEQVRTFPAGSPADGVVLFDKGDRLDNSIETTVGASVGYSFPFGSSGLTGVIAVSANRSTPKVFKSLKGNLVSTNRGDAVFMSSARLGIDSLDGWSASLFIDNVNNEDGALYKSVEANGETQAFYPRPRTIGLQVEFSY